MTKFYQLEPHIKLFVIPVLLFILFILHYSSYSKFLPVSYWDEYLWVGRSYFFDFYIHGDFDNRIWQSYESYDQPKLAEYSYGAWLYPLYLKQKAQNKSVSDYTRFLIQNGFYEIDEFYMSDYADYKNTVGFLKIDENQTGSPDDYITKYDTDSIKSLDLIYYARRLNALLLAGAVVFVYFLTLSIMGPVWATAGSLLYGFNSLILDNTLKAHSEALFLFTFNAAVLFMIYYFTKRKFFYLLLFSIFTGLCMATKLNGSMLLAMFSLSNLVLFFVSRKKQIEQVLLMILPVLISLVIFVSLNPFTYSDPFKNVQYMFDWRMKEASVCLAHGSNEICLPNWGLRISRIFENFYFSKQSSYFNGVGMLNQVPATPKNYGIYVFALFGVGLFYSLKLAFNKTVSAITIVCSFITALLLMGYYLILDWNRYYVPLSLFFLMFQLFGLSVVATYAKLFVRRAIHRTKNKRF